MTFEIVFRRTYSTDEADPICQQDDDRVVRWFAGEPLTELLLAEGFGLEVRRSK